MFGVFLSQQHLGGLLVNVQGHEHSISPSIVATFGQRIILCNIIIRDVFQQ